MDISDDCVRRRAYRIWEAEGRPPGKHDEHWRRAREDIEREHRLVHDHAHDMDHRLPLHVEEALSAGP
jgi:hypothetical protein